MADSNFVRIRTESGAEVSVSAAYAEAIGAEALDTPAMNHRGQPLRATRKDGRPIKPRTSVSTEVAKKTAAKKTAAKKATATPGGVAAKQPEEAPE